MLPQMEAFTTISVHLAHVYAIQARTFGQRIWNKFCCYWGICWVHALGCMSPHLIVWVEFPFLTLFIVIFGLPFYNSLGIYGDSYLLV
jgi:hypothetical protein